jgi:hypothetical protein
MGPFKGSLRVRPGLDGIHIQARCWHLMDDMAMFNARLVIWHGPPYDYHYTYEKVDWC